MTPKRLCRLEKVITTINSIEKKIAAHYGTLNMCRKFWTFMWTKVKKNYFFQKDFFSSSKKLNIEKENVIFLNTFLNFNLFDLIVVFLFVNFVHMNVQNFRYIPLTRG